MNVIRLVGATSLALAFAAGPAAAQKKAAPKPPKPQISEATKQKAAADNANPEALVAFIGDQGPSARVRPDMKVVFFADWERPADRLKGAARILSGLVRIAEPAKAA